MNRFINSAAAELAEQGYISDENLAHMNAQDILDAHRINDNSQEQ